MHLQLILTIAHSNSCKSLGPKCLQVEISRRNKNEPKTLQPNSETLLSLKKQQVVSEYGEAGAGSSDACACCCDC